MSGGMNWDRARDAERLSRAPSAGLIWWIVFARKGSRCSGCRAETYGQAIALHHDTETAYCEACWTRLGIQPKPSRNYLKGLASATKATGQKGRKARRRRQRSRRPANSSQ